MRLVSVHGNSLRAAVLACIIPVMQSRAEEPVCVEYEGLKHCGMAGAGVKKTGSGVKVENHDTSGPGGVIIHTGTTTSWTAGTFIEGVGESEDSKTVFSSVSDGATPASTSSTSAASAPHLPEGTLPSGRLSQGAGRRREQESDFVQPGFG
ncbi:hypothetical protein ACLESO_05210 [Pyxidicoccus sp. 3LG]